jgi:DNA-binding SARP family transcriptional activator
MAGTRLRLLNGFALSDARARVDLSPGMQRLIAFLALRGPAHRCVMAGTLWPEVPEGHALASLRTGIWRLNRLLPGSIVTDGMSLSTARSLTVDSREQEQFATRLLRDRIEDEQWITERLDVLWPGELLPGWYDDWVVFDRGRLAQLRLHALEHTALVMARSHQLETAFQLALEAVRAEPLRESANATLMEVYLAEGNVIDAVHQFNDYRRLLHLELGVDPSPALGRMLARQGVVLTPG